VEQAQQARQAQHLRWLALLAQQVFLALQVHKEFKGQLALLGLKAFKVILD
jgi:hypothetical protein